MTSRSEEALWPGSRGGRWDVVGLGEISLDSVGVFSGAARIPGKRDLASLERQPGGTIATAVLGCQRLGLSSALLGAVGADAEADAALRPLAEAGVDLSGVVTVESAATRTAFITVEPDSGDRMVHARRSPALNLDPGRLHPGTIREARTLLIDVSDPEAATWAADLARAEQVPVVLDADTAWADSESLLSRVDFPIVSESLARHLGGTPNVLDGLGRLVKEGARLAVATRGEAGCVAFSPSGALTIPAFPCRALDTTGAGDAFRAGFVWGLLAGRGIREVLQAGCAAGALNCRRLGAQDGLPTRPELEALLASPGPS